MLAQHLATIQPAMALVEALEPNLLDSVPSLIGDCTALATARPCHAATTPSPRWA
jgi:hypothetical protein